MFKTLSKDIKQIIYFFRHEFNWDNFITKLMVWLISSGLIFSIFLIITALESDQDIWINTFKKNDVLNLVFSLNLASLLDTIFDTIADNNGTKKPLKYIIGVQFILVFIGLVFYIVYSIADIHSDVNIFTRSKHIWIQSYFFLSIFIHILTFGLTSAHK